MEILIYNKAIAIIDQNSPQNVHWLRGRGLSFVGIHR